MTGWSTCCTWTRPGYAHARDRWAWAADLPARLALHEQGQGARLLAVAMAADRLDIRPHLARTRAREGQLKRRAVRPGAARSAASLRGQVHSTGDRLISASTAPRWGRCDSACPGAERQPL